MNKWNLKHSRFDTSKKNLLDTGLIIAVLQSYKSKGKKPPKRVNDTIHRYIKNLRNPKEQKDKHKKKKEEKDVVTAKSKQPGFKASTEESAVLAATVLLASHDSLLHHACRFMVPRIYHQQCK